MGIPGLNTFVRENHLRVPFHLRNTVLVIDGLNLENALYNGSLKLHNDKAYGGDYAYFSAYIETFFETLADCAIKPVIIMDGSIQADKLRKKKARFNARLSRAKIISKTRNGNYGVNSLFNPHVFVQVIKRLRIPVYKCIFEADDILARIATDLGAPLLSADGDFLVSHLAAGVIDTGSLFWRGKLKVGTDRRGRYINCELFKLEHLQKKFPGLKPELVSLGGAILGNDYLSASMGLINRFARRPAGSDELKHREQIESVFGWLSGQASVPDVLSNLKKHSAPRRLIIFIENRLLNSSPPHTVSRSLSIEQYFTVNRSSLFKRDPAVPQWAHDAYVDERLHRRAMAIFLVQLDFLRALIEDYSLEKSSYETVFELFDAIYGLLRSEDQNPMPVSRFVRSGVKRKDETITPVIQIANKRLPLLSEISKLSKSERITLFYEILDIPSSIQTEIKDLLTSTLPKSISDQLMTLLLSTIYLCRHFSTDIWIDFFYALTANFLLMGHFSAEQQHPTVLNLRKSEHNQLFKALKVFNTIPSSSVRFEPRIVHQYNSFQNCLDNIAFLAQILDLADIFHADHLVSGLQGTIIYNLTIDLTFRDKPLSHLEHNLLGGLSFKYKKLFLAVLDFLLSHSGRKMVANGQAVSKQVIPKAFQAKKKSTCPAGTRFFVRGLPKKVSIKRVTPVKARIKRTKISQPVPDPVTACQKTALIGFPKNSSSIWPEQFGPVAKDSTCIKTARNKVTRKKAFPKEPESLKNGSNFWPEQFGPVSSKAHPRGRRGGRRVNRQVAGVSLVVQ